MQSAKNLQLTSCAFLRTKNDFVTYPEKDDNDESMTPKVYWCGKTLSEFGPDGEQTGLSECQQERTCYCEKPTDYTKPFFEKEKNQKNA
jgi:hypothetical protein